MEPSQSFGGPWTKAKLSVIQKYLAAYVKLMRGNERASHFRLTYLDGFAGSGRRYGELLRQDSHLFSEFHDEETEAFYRGSPYRALEVSPAFDSYIFIENKPEYAAELDKLKLDFPDRTSSIKIVQGNANEVVPGWCRTLQAMDRALVFLDPYGMQVNWTTVQAIAATQKIDLWVLVPLGQALIRLLTDREPPADWAKALTRFFGNDDWREHFYPTRQKDSLFGAEEGEIRDVDFQRLTTYVVQRFGGTFASVLHEPLLLRNTRGTPLYLLCFAASNPKGAPTAVRIARDIVGRKPRGH